MKTINFCFWIVLFSFILIGTGYAQQPERCGFDQAIESASLQDPGYADRVKAAFDRAKDRARSHSGREEDTLFRIPVVVHIVYTNDNENLDDSLVHSQIAALNRDFRRQNADTVNTRQEFLAVAADAGIEFYLADKDPEGNPTDGITRTEGSPGFPGFYTIGSDNIKSDALGGKSPWPTDRYLNIWVGNTGGFILGYAFPPTDAPNWSPGNFADSSHQGVVIYSQVFGMNNPTNVFYTDLFMGRTGVHEVGHYLGLRHVWGDGGCTQDDGMDDTPRMASESGFTCDHGKNTCTDSPVDLPDMIENYMDYSNDECLNMFSREQADIMRAHMATSRNGLVTWDTVVPPPPDTTVGVVPRTPHFVNVYPNPASDQLIVEMGNLAAETVHLRIYNILGELAIATTSATTRKIINTRKLPPGAYVLVTEASGNRYIRKFMIR